MNTSFEKWCEKLLDTGKSNRLINFKSSLTRNIEIYLPDTGELFEKISSGNLVSFFDVDEYLKKSKKEFDVPIEEIKTSQIIEKIELNKKQIFSYKQGYQMKKILKNLKKISNESLTEKGINILYTAFGMLRWSEKDKDNEILFSPLVLIPVALEYNMVNSVYTLKEYEDEITTNPTLIYKLKNENNFVLPEFRQVGFEEETLYDYFERVKESVSVKGWTVIDQVHIGTFSFLKLNMYKDLRENEEKILENVAIKKLLNQKIDEVEEKIDVDTDSLEHSLHNVVDADSSQMMAIMQAKLGKSFVLQGPPGTGKSQTITNLIAEFLFDGKKILFVSEKLAALKVVFNNLKRAGLSDFCLELHSNKTNKKDVLNELYAVLSRNKKHINSKAEVSASELKKAENQLDNYANALHEKNEILDKSPYEVLSEISKFRNAPNLEYAFEEIESFGIDEFQKIVETLEKFVRFCEPIGFDYKKNVWYGYNNTDTSFGLKIDLKKHLENALSTLNQINDFSTEIEDIAWIDISSISLIEKRLEYIKLLSNLQFFDKNIFSNNNLKHITNAVNILVEHKNRLKSNEIELSKELSLDLLKEDVNALCLRFENDYSSFFRFLNKNYKQDKKLLLKYSVDGKKLKYSQMLNDLKLAREIVNLRKVVIQDEEGVFNLLSQSKDDNAFDWKMIQTELQQLSKFDVELSKNLGNFEKEQFVDAQEKFKEFIRFLNLNQEDFTKLKDVQKYFDLTIFNVSEVSLYQLSRKIKDIQSNFDNLENWVRLYLICNELSELKVLEFVDFYIDSKNDKTNLISSFTLMYYYQWFCQISSKKPEFSEFSRQIQDMAVESFCKNDKLKFEISKAEIISKLSSEMPDLNSLTSGSQISILAREAQKKSKQKPVRVLLKEIGQLVQTLKPCFLMSPLSVSTYLDSNTCKFDVVIFDEASQIFPWDAIGAISRATQVIVVGDSKQMPPSNFFNAGLSTIEENYNEESEEDDALDFESILDLCSSVFSQNRLNWHYRSKTEDLIAFSNYNYYDNSLVTFPSPKKNNPEMGVNFYYVPDGIFNRKSKTNIVEAEKVVDLVFEHFKTNSNSSLGVVAFSISQQEAIEDLISKRREKDDSFAEYFDSDRDEPFFVKNLETVQGDERDTIIFSIAYAKGDDGKFLHNFGPLNQKGGERRLNVAVTRAKYNVKIVSSIKSFDIDLNKTSAVGSKMLKDYLEMAEKGVQNWTEIKQMYLQNENNQSIGELESEIQEFLTESGYVVEKNVGCSECKIDLVVKHPENNDYIVAIECDGPSYIKGKTTRDRDRLRKEVLERLGWNFYRIWSLDWFINKNSEKELLLKFIKKSLENYNKPKTKENIEQKKTEQDEKEEKNSFVVEEEFEKKDLRSMFLEYEEYPIDYTGNYSFDKVAYEIVKFEAPITEELLLKKTLHLFGREKITSYVREKFITNMRRLDGRIFKTFDFYVIDREMNISLRIPKKNAIPREITMIADIELASGLYVIISHNVGITEKGLFDTIVNLLGFTRVGPKMQEKLEKSLKILINTNKVKLVDGQYFKVE